MFVLNTGYKICDNIFIISSLFTCLGKVVYLVMFFATLCDSFQFTPGIINLWSTLSL